MKVQYENQELHTTATRRAKFEISQSNSAHIMRILRDTLYSDKILAVIREYASNAWDAHRMVGKPDLPIKVHIPTAMDSNLRIRDYGPGMSEWDVFQVFTKYGESTKRDTNSAVGMLGIGAKSGFAYATSFSVTSWHNGYRRNYVAALDDTDQGEMQRLTESLWSPLVGLLRKDLEVTSFPLQDEVPLDEVEGPYPDLPKLLVCWMRLQGHAPTPEVDPTSIPIQHLKSFLGLPELLASPDAEPRITSETGISTIEFPKYLPIGKVTSSRELQVLTSFWADLHQWDPEEIGFETGIEIKIAVSSQDHYDFRTKATEFFKHFHPAPKINIHVPTLMSEGDIFKSGWLKENPNHRYSTSSAQWVAVMGCVPYNFDMSQVYTPLQNLGLIDPLTKLQGAVFLEVGDADINASREELKYSDKTKDALVKGLQTLLQEYLSAELGKLKGSDATFWQKRMIALQLRDKFGQSLPIAEYPEIADLLDRRLTLWDATPPKTFVLKRADQTNTPVNVIGVSDRIRLILVQSDKPIKGFSTDPHDYFVVAKHQKASNASWGEITKELKQILKDAGAFGVTIKSTKKLYFSTPRISAAAPYEPTKDQKAKYKGRIFTYRGRQGSPLSAGWELKSDHEPSEDDVFIVMSYFKDIQDRDFYYLHRKDSELADALEIQMPTVVGYKSTARKPINAEEIEGVEYFDWRVKFFKQQVTRTHRLRMAALEWKETTGLDNSWSKRSAVALLDHLPKTHPLTKLIKRSLREVTRWENLTPNQQDAILQLRKLIPKRKRTPTAIKHAREALKDYPLLENCIMPSGKGRIRFQAVIEPKLWAEYVALVDSTQGRTCKPKGRRPVKIKVNGKDLDPKTEGRHKILFI